MAVDASSRVVGGPLAEAAGRALLVPVLLFFAACGVAGQAGHFGGNGEIPVTYVSRGRDLSVEVSFEVQTGEAGFVVIDPQARVRYRSSTLGEGEAYAEMLDLRGPPGEWQVVFTVRAAEGRYEVEWHE